MNMNIRRLDIWDFGGIPTLGPWKRKYKGEGVNMRFVGYYREVRKEHKLLFGPFRDSLPIGNRLISQKIRSE